MKFTWFRKKKFNHRREGSSLVSVVIGVLFLAAIGSTILTVATRYVVSVYTSKTSSSNFYETEGILTEVRTGLIEYAAEASKVSYEYVLEHYMEKDRNAKMRYSERFINQLVLKLTDKASFDVASEVNESKQIIPGREWGLQGKDQCTDPGTSGSEDRSFHERGLL